MNKDRLKWLEGRRCALGGSDISAIMGLSKWNTPLDIWESKTGRAEVSDEMNEPCYWGTVMEETIVKEFERRTGFTVKVDNEQLVHPKHDYMMGNVDGIVESESAILECKTASAFMASKWGEEGTDEIPVDYYYQVQHYMCIYGYDLTYVAVLIGGNDFRVYKVEKDKDVIEQIEAMCAAFWNLYVLTNQRPPLIDSDKARMAQTIAALKGSSIVSNSIELAEDLEKLKELKESKKQIDERLKKINSRVQGFMGENENLLTNDGEVMCTWKSSITKRFDSKKLKKDNLELYTKYSTESESRRFLVK